MRLIALLVAGCVLVGCGSSGSDSVSTSESTPKDASASAAPATEAPMTESTSPDAPVSNGDSTPASAPKADDSQAHSADDGHSHGTDSKPSTGAKLETKAVEGQWTGSGDGTNGKENYAMTVKSTMEVEMNVTSEGSPAARFTGRWEIDQDAVIMHLLKVTINGESRDIHTDLVWKLEDGKLVLQSGPATGKVKLSRKG